MIFCRARLPRGFWVRKGCSMIRPGLQLELDQHRSGLRLQALHDVLASHHPEGQIACATAVGFADSGADKVVPSARISLTEDLEGFRIQPAGTDLTFDRVRLATLALLPGVPDLPGPVRPVNHETVIDIEPSICQVYLRLRRQKGWLPLNTFTTQISLQWEKSVDFTHSIVS